MASVSKEQRSFGCEHYKRRCMLISPCCGKKYMCRFCHDENEAHELDRTAVNEVVCTVCATVQKVNKTCSECQVLFGKYFCEKCRLYDYEDKDQFHCDECGLCRVGGRDNFFHCSTCGCCMALSLKNNHQCVKNATRRKCPVCDKDLHSSRDDLHCRPCLHLVHRKCVQARLDINGTYQCPACVYSIENGQTEKDGVLLCMKCHKSTKLKFRTGPLRCSECGSQATTWTELSEEAEQAELACLAGEVAGVSFRESASEDEMGCNYGEVAGSRENKSVMSNEETNEVWGAHEHVDGSADEALMSHGEVGGLHRTGP